MGTDGAGPGVRDLVVDALAVHRITRLVTEDTVPFGPARDWVMDHWPGSLPAEWVSCPWCASVTVAAGVAAARVLAPRWWPYPAVALALSSVAGLLTTWEQRGVERVATD